MPKFALANDLWMGRLPAELATLSQGAWLLLPLARCMIKRKNCKTDSHKWQAKDERIEAYVGNVCAFMQADGGRALASLPPSPSELAERLLIVFTGPEEDLENGFCKELGVDPVDSRRAYEFLHRANATYHRVSWNDQNAAELAPAEHALGLPRILAACLRWRLRWTWCP